MSALAAQAVPAAAQSTVTVACAQAALMDAESHSFLFERAPDELSSPASTAKVMTAEILFRLIKEGKVSLDQTYEISEHAWRTGGAPSRGSAMFASLHSQVRVEDLIKGLVIDSGNDAAIAIAEGVAGTEEAFGQMMTRRARELGLNHLTFTNPWGRSDPNQKTNVREMALLADHVIKTYPDLYKYFSEKQFTWNKITQENRNPLLNMNIGADGLKTGNIDEGGFAIVGSAVDNNQRLIVALNGCKTATDRAEDSRKLLLWGFRSFEARTVFQPGETVGTVKIYGGAQSEAPVAADQVVKIFLPRGSTDRITGKIVYDGPIIPPVQKGAILAHLQIMRGSAVALDIPLRSTEDVGVGSLQRRALDASVEFAGQMFRKYVLKK
ncbi:MAG: D-alanyl-D-alanine carboxypeptidase [Hyphomicrobiales bacterium]|nr:D-alanyl-D-alanine carboxypeptidase [Hyphomicrobiales bacterium]